MKLILTPTDPSYGPKVAISGPYDGSNIHDVIDTLVTPALIAYGFHPANIREAYENADVPQEAPRRDALDWGNELDSVPLEPPYPELPDVPPGYSCWTLPRLTSEVGEERDVPGVMAFFHASGRDGDDDWIVTNGGTYGGRVSDKFAYPTYYVHAL